MNKRHLILFAFLAMAGCNSSNEKTENSETTHEHHENALHNDPVGEVMAIHDSIMPSMDKIMKLKSVLNADLKNIDSIAKVSPTKEITQKKEATLSLISQLEKADKEMMSWMRQYNGDTLKKIDEDAAKAYLQDQKSKIETVRDLMQKSIVDAEIFIKK